MFDVGHEPSIFVICCSEPTYIEGGLYWDDTTVLETLRWLNKMYRHPAAAAIAMKQPTPSQLMAILKQLHLAINKQPGRLTVSCTVEELRAGLQSVVRKACALAQAEV